VPYLVIIGDKEISEKTIAVRKRTGENIGPLAIDEFIRIIKKEVDSKQ
jgi:threonyl-tRNA synthetase